MPSPPSSFLLPPFLIRLPLAAGLIALAVALFTAAIYWNPVGGRKDGRVMVVERHSKWEPTTKPYDTNVVCRAEAFRRRLGLQLRRESTDYLGQYYQMSRLLEKDKIDDETLAKCDVLVIKMPTERYSPEEAAAVRAVRRAGRRAAVDRRSHELRAVGHRHERHHPADGLHLPRRSAVQLRRVALRTIVRAAGACRIRPCSTFRRWISPSPARSIRATAAAGR